MKDTNKSKESDAGWGKLTPGSRHAVERGCTCPVLDNAHGYGYMGMPGVFVYADGCPIHSKKPVVTPGGE
jgi:hypothetical protein